MNKVLCIIPARGGSKGLIGKNTRQLLDKPLIAWTIDEAKKSKYIDKIVVSTEDAHIKEVSKQHGADVIDRPDSLSTDQASTTDVVFHSLKYLQDTKKYSPDYVLLLQCTSPLRNVHQIDEAIKKLLTNQINVDALISVTKEEHPPWWLRRINADGYLERYFDYDASMLNRRQDFIELYRPNGAIYLAKTNLFYEKKTFQTEKTLPYIMDNLSSIDIDTEYDFRWAEMVMKEKLK